MLKNQIIKILFAVNLVSLGAQAGILDNIEQRPCRRGNTTVQATAYEQSKWLGETASYAQAVGIVDVETEKDHFVCSTGTAIAPNLVLTTAHSYKSFHSIVFIFNYQFYNVSHVILRPSKLTLKHNPTSHYDIALLYLESPLPLKSFPSLSTLSDTQLFPQNVTPDKSFIEGWCVAGGILRSNFDTHPEEIKRHVTYAKLYISPPSDPHRYYSEKFRTAKNLPQVPTEGKGNPLLPGYEVDKDAPLLAAPLCPGDSGAPFFVKLNNGKYKLAAICAGGRWMDSLDLKNRIFRPNEEFLIAYTTINNHLNWLRKILKKYNAEAYQPELFALKQA